MIIGIDFDNTFVSYSDAISQLAPQFFNDLPPNLSLTKTSLKQYLVSSEREQEWTEFQGLLYGPGMSYASPFEGVFSTLVELASAGFTLKIISHRTLHPYLGPQYDLHSCAFHWLANYLEGYPDIFEAPYNTSSNSIFFCETIELKLSTIHQHNCNFFIDDLPTVLRHPLFPLACSPILFDPFSFHTDTSATEIKSLNSWPAIFKYLTKKT